MPSVHLLNHVTGNIRSLVNAIEKLGYTVEWIKTPKDVLLQAERLIPPGIGYFGPCLSQISQSGYSESIKHHVSAGKPFLGICVGMQALFEGSEEDKAVPGLGLIKGKLKRFLDTDKSVPHIGWNSVKPVNLAREESKTFYGLHPASEYYYVQSYVVPYHKGLLEEDVWTVATAQYGNEEFNGAIGRGSVFATQSHPEESGQAGARVLEAFLSNQPSHVLEQAVELNVQPGLTRRIIACLDVRSNDARDLGVTKGDHYDVREKTGAPSGGQVRNLGKPVDVAKRYYEQGADEITFLNITSFRDCPLKYAHMRADTNKERCIFIDYRRDFNNEFRRYTLLLNEDQDPFCTQWQDACKIYEYDLESRIADML